MHPALQRVILGASPNVWNDANVTLTGDSQRLDYQLYRVFSSAGALAVVQVSSVLTLGRTYEVTFNIDSIATLGSGIRIGDTGDVFTTVGAKSSRFIASASVNAFFKRNGGVTDITISNVSFRAH